MTAPLYFKPDHKTNKEATLPILTNRLLDAIDENDERKVGEYIDLVLKQTDCADYFAMLYRYALAHEHAGICEHIRDIVAVISNMDICTSIERSAI